MENYTVFSKERQIISSVINDLHKFKPGDNIPDCIYHMVVYDSRFPNTDQRAELEAFASAAKFKYIVDLGFAKCHVLASPNNPDLDNLTMEQKWSRRLSFSFYLTKITEI